jgi:hypothetical protein
MHRSKRSMSKNSRANKAAAAAAQTVPEADMAADLAEEEVREDRAARAAVEEAVVEEAGPATGGPGADNAGRKCPITPEQFRVGARAVTVVIGDEKKTALVKEFSTGSFGWFMNEKIVMEVMVDGEPVPVKVQANVNLTIVGSKPGK